MGSLGPYNPRPREARFGGVIAPVSRSPSVCGLVVEMLVATVLIMAHWPGSCQGREPLKFSGSLGITHRTVHYVDESEVEELSDVGSKFVDRTLSTQFFRFGLSGPLLDEKFLDFVARGTLEGQWVASEVPDDTESEYIGPNFTNYSVLATLLPTRPYVHWLSFRGADFETVEYEDKNRYLAVGDRPYLSVVRRYTNESSSFGAGGRYNLGLDRNLLLRYEKTNRSSIKVFDYAEDDDLSYDIVFRDLGIPITPGNVIMAVTNGTQEVLSFFVDGDFVDFVQPKRELRKEIDRGFHTLRAEVGENNPLEINIFAIEDFTWGIRIESVPPPLDLNVEMESSSADLDFKIENTELGMELGYSEGFDITNSRDTFSTSGAFTALIPIAPWVDLNHTTDYFNEISKVPAPGEVFATSGFTSGADLSLRNVASSDMRIMYRFSANEAGETSTDSHDLNFIAVRDWPLGVESRATALYTDRTSVPHTIQTVRRLSAGVVVPARAYGIDMRPGYTFTLDYNDMAPGSDTHLLEHDVYIDMGTTIGGSTFLNTRFQLDRESRKEFARPSDDLPSELSGERVKLDRRFGFAGASKAISWVDLNWIVEKNKGISRGEGRFSASDTDDLFIRGKGTFREIMKVALTAEASLARSLTVDIRRFRFGHISMIKTLKGRFWTGLDFEKRKLSLDPESQVKDRDSVAFLMSVDGKFGKFNMRGDFEYRRVKDFRRESDTNVTMFFMSFERSFNADF